MVYSGNLLRSYSVARAAPTGRAQPGQHTDAPEPSDRDNAPAGGGWQPETWDRTEWLSTYGSPIDLNPPGPHDVPQTHEGNDGKGDPPSVYLEYGRHRIGGDDPAVDHGAGGAAHGGLRRDNGTQWANPGGFNLGHEHTLVNEDRHVGRHLTHGALRPTPEAQLQTGQSSSPGAPRGRFTSPYNPIDDVRTFGVQVPTLRRVLRPNGDREFVPTDETPNGRGDLDVSVIGDQWVL